MRGGSLTVSIALVAMLMLSGCGGKSSTDSSPASSSSKTSSSSAPSTTSAPSGNATDQAPVINMFASNKTAGAAPLKVQFKLNATDADKDALTYRLVFGDGSANATGSLPGLNVTHTYAAKGNYTARLFVSDGRLAVNKTASKIVVTGGHSGPPLQTFDGKWSYTSADCPGASSTSGPAAAYFPSPLKGIAYDSVAVMPATVGTTYLATFVLTGGGSGGIYFADAGGSTVQRVNPSTDPLTGTVPAGAATAYFFSCLNEPDAASVHYTAG